MKKVLAIVAHPDDETIWMGGLLLKNPDWKWTIFSLCRKKDSDRMPKFINVCKAYGAKAIIGDLDDEKLLPLNIDELCKFILDKISSEKYDYIFTHGKNGEYGHIRHKEIHLAVKKLVDEKMLRTDKVYYFSYIPSDRMAPHNKELAIPVANQNADMIIELDENYFAKKYNIITKLYGFKDGIFETLSCGKKEAFLNGR